MMRTLILVSLLICVFLGNASANTILQCFEAHKSRLLTNPEAVLQASVDHVYLARYALELPRGIVPSEEQLDIALEQLRENVISTHSNYQIDMSTVTPIPEESTDTKVSGTLRFVGESPAGVFNFDVFFKRDTCLVREIAIIDSSGLTVYSLRGNLRTHFREEKRRRAADANQR